MRFIIYGAGAIGGNLGGHLYRTNHDVIPVGNAEFVDRIRESGRVHRFRRKLSQSGARIDALVPMAVFV